MSSIELRSSRLRVPERMPAIERILNCCRWGLPFRARAGISSGAMRTLNDGEQGDGGQEVDFHSREGSAIGIKCRTGRGAKLSMRGWASITWQL